MTRGASLLAALVIVCVAAPASAQGTPPPPPPEPGTPQAPASPPPATSQLRTQPSSAGDAIRVRGFGTLGAMSFRARDSFDAVLETRVGVTAGGGGQVLLPWGFYAEVAAWQFKKDGQRVIVGPGDEVFRLGIPVRVAVTPIEVTGGWRYRHCPAPARRPPGARPLPPRPCAPRLIPYAGGGYSSYKYSETSDGADASENVDERFHGVHLVGGAEYQVTRWVAIGGEALWSRVPDALSGGVAAIFDEHDLGGSAVRLKVTFGR